jgi:hypothetical protein
VGAAMDIVSKSILVHLKTSCVVAAAVIYMKYKCIKCGGGEAGEGVPVGYLHCNSAASFSHSNPHARM